MTSSKNFETFSNLNAERDSSWNSSERGYMKAIIIFDSIYVNLTYVIIETDQKSKDGN